jgi:hypothetical protein
MNYKEKVIAYETHIEDLLHAILERKIELDSAEALDTFQQGRQLAYEEVIDMIKTRHAMILELLED